MDFYKIKELIELKRSGDLKASRDLYKAFNDKKSLTLRNNLLFELLYNDLIFDDKYAFEIIDKILYEDMWDIRFLKLFYSVKLKDNNFIKDIALSVAKDIEKKHRQML